MAKDLLLPGSILSLHRSAVEKLLKAGNGDAALLYLCLTAGQNSGPCPGDRTRWRRPKTPCSGWASSPRTPRFSPPAGKAGGRPAPGLHHPGHRPGLPERRGLQGPGAGGGADAGEGPLPADLKILYTLFDFLALPPEVILTLTGWCVEQAKQKGPGRKPTLTQIRREAYKWQKAGIDTLEAADAHLHRLSRRNRRGTEILQLLFGESRAPVEKEAEFLDAWIQMGCSDELLLLARDRTIFQLQEFKWTYMNGILTRWYKEGLTTVEAVEASERKNRRPQYPRATPQPAQGAQPLPSDDIGRMIEQARRAAAAKEG